MGSAVEVVRAELGKEIATTGEAVPMIVTLYSPGPFSGTASFELPEVARTVFAKAGNPVVGSEQIGDQSFFTQQHEFAIYTQQSGEIVIPPFSVEFAGKTTFTSAPEAMKGLTRELRFQSTRPPGTEHLGMVIAARNMEMNQTWKPDTDKPIEAGDVITRTISRRATGTMAMMFPPIALQVSEGVRSYATDPTVQDFTERGDTRAERSEAIRYQFARSGTFSLPDVTVTWWDPDVGALRRETLAGKVVSVRDEIVAVEPVAPARSSLWPLLVLLVMTGSIAWWVCRSMEKRLATRRSDRATNAARRVFNACRSNASDEAYAALLQWKRAVEECSRDVCRDDSRNSDTAAEFENEWNALSRHVYGVGINKSPWSGQRLADVFTRVQRGMSETSGAKGVKVELPALNPTS
jgi:hypothetical protein